MVTELYPYPCIHNLESYIQYASRIPFLTEEKEKELADRLRRDNDPDVLNALDARDSLDAARQLVLPHLYFVVKIARGYIGYGLPLADLIQEGNIGLMKAVKRFDPDRKNRLVSFAVHWIRAEIHDFILRNWRIVRIATTKAQRKLFFNLRSHHTARNGRKSLDSSDIACLTNDLDVSEKDVREMEQRLHHHDCSFDVPAAAGMDSPGSYLSDERTPDPEQIAEASEQISLLRSGLTLLPERSRQIIEQRWLRQPKKTLGELADELGLSAERVRQIEAQAFAAIQASITDGGPQGQGR